MSITITQLNSYLEYIEMLREKYLMSSNVGKRTKSIESNLLKMRQDGIRYLKNSELAWYVIDEIEKETMYPQLLGYIYEEMVNERDYVYRLNTVINNIKKAMK